MTVNRRLPNLQTKASKGGALRLSINYLAAFRVGCGLLDDLCFLLFALVLFCTLTCCPPSAAMLTCLEWDNWLWPICDRNSWLSMQLLVTWCTHRWLRLDMVKLVAFLRGWVIARTPSRLGCMSRISSCLPFHCWASPTPRSFGFTGAVNTAQAFGFALLVFCRP